MPHNALHSPKTTRWTPEQLESLLQAVQEHPTKKQAFAHIATQLGKDIRTVTQKYYNHTRWERHRA